MEVIRSIQNRIFEIRDEGVILDFDLAELYEVATKALSQAVKRNIKRFPEDFMFRLTSLEWISVRSQIVTASQNKRNTDSTPYAFTEQGVAMLSGVLNTEKAINMNIAIMRAFIEIRRIATHEMDLKTQLREIKERLGEHDVQLNQIYDAMEKWWATKMFIVAEGIQRGAVFLESFVTYPPSQDPASFSIDDISARVKDQIKMLHAQQNAIRK